MSGGKERSQKVRRVRVQEGSEGWRVAQEREVMRGCALDVRGDMAARDGGRTSSFLGYRIGDINGLQKGRCVSTNAL